MLFHLLLCLIPSSLPLTQHMDDCHSFISPHSKAASLLPSTGGCALGLAELALTLTALSLLDVSDCLELLRCRLSSVPGPDNVTRSTMGWPCIPHCLSACVLTALYHPFLFSWNTDVIWGVWIMEQKPFKPHCPQGTGRCLGAAPSVCVAWWKLVAATSMNCTGFLGATLLLSVCRFLSAADLSWTLRA